MAGRRFCPTCLRCCCSFSSSESDSEVYQQNQTESTVRQNPAEREASCFSRAARRIRHVLSRICRVGSHRSRNSPRDYENICFGDISDEAEYGAYATYSCICTEDMLESYINYPANNQDDFPQSQTLNQPLNIERHSQCFMPRRCRQKLKLPVQACVTSVTKSVLTRSDAQNLSTCRNQTLPRSHSLSSLSPTSSQTPENKTLVRSKSLTDMRINCSFEDFTPDITVDGDLVTYRFQGSGPGLYRCSVTGLLFQMKGEGDVVYRTVPWNRRLLVQHHQKPAGPLFDITCLQQSVCQLHLPHCEIPSTGGCGFLSVAHVTDEGVDLITPDQITETHVVINITGFSAYGNVKDEDSPPDPVRALVLLFYRPPADPDPESLINVLLLPKNVCLWKVQHTRRKLVGEERYIETSPHCKLLPDQSYSLFTRPHDDSVEVQPTQAEFIADCYDNYFPSFQVDLEKVLKQIKLILTDSNTSLTAWERRVDLSSRGQSSGSSRLNVPLNERLLGVRSSFTDRISGPVLKSLLDKLLEKKVMSESEREAADGQQSRADTARFVLDTVRKKGEAASSEMIALLSELDPFLCQHLEMI